MTPRPELSVVVPFFNEEDSVGPLYRAIVVALDPLGISFEIVLVDDGSTDTTVARAVEIARRDSRVRIVKFRRNYGQTAAMAAGIEHATGRVLVTMDGDLQNDPADIGLFLAKMNEGFDIVVGWRHQRQDKLVSRKIPSRIANWLIGKVTGVPIKDNGCSLKAYRASVIKAIPLYSEMHRFIPAMASMAGPRIAEIKVRHHARQFGKSKYGLSRIYKVILDLLVIKTVSSFTSRPLLWFSLLSLPVIAFALIAFGYTVFTVLVHGERMALPVVGSGFIFGCCAVMLMSSGAIGELVYKLGDVRERDFSRLTESVHGAGPLVGRIIPMVESDSPIALSVVIPVGVRHADLLALYGDYRSGLSELQLRYETIFVLDGPNPEAVSDLQRLRDSGAAFEVVRLTKAFGESTALMAGFERARGSIVMTLPGYYQIESAEIPKLVLALATADVAVGRRWPRAGGGFESLRRRAFHRAVNWMTGLRLGDLGCGARAMKRRVIEEIFLYGDQHRFLAVLAHRQGFRVAEIDVQQSPRDRFEGRYRLREYAHRALDILTVLFLVRFTKKPLRFFGMIGLSVFAVGMLVLLALVIERLFFGQQLADRPALLLTSLLVVLGLQLFALGLLGELIIFTHARSIKDYQVESVIQFPDRTPDSISSDGAHDIPSAR